MTGKKPTKGQSDSHGTVFAASDKQKPRDQTVHEEPTTTASRYRTQLGNPPPPPPPPAPSASAPRAPAQPFKPAPPGARAQRWSDAPTELRDNPLEGDDFDDPPTLATPLRDHMNSDPPTMVRPQSTEGITLDDSDLLMSDDDPRTENTGIEDLPTMDMPIDFDEHSSASSPPFDPKPIGMFGRYHLLGRLAMGGMAEIFLARENADSQMSRFIVIKRIRSTVAEDNEFVSMFLNEARLAMQLKHPTICHLYEFGFEAGHHFLAMEYVDGATVHKIARKAQAIGGVPIPIAITIVSQVAGALNYAHSAKDSRRVPLNIVHRDVSPHNVMVGYDGVVKLLDFGVAKASTQDVLTMAGVVRGKFAYMSPQQCVGEKLDGRSDIFSLGIVLYEILTGQRLYRRENQFETMRAVVDDPVPSIRAANPRLPAELDRIVQKALQKDPNERYATADLMQQDLDRFLADRREVVSSSRVASFMEDLFKEEIRKGPEIDQDVEFETSLPSIKQEPPAQGGMRRNTGQTTQRDIRKPQAHTTMRVATRRRSINTEWIYLGLAVVAVIAALAVIAMKVTGRPDVPPEANAGSQGAQPPKAADVGRVRVNGPEGSTVFVDGIDQGLAPTNVPGLSLTSHKIEVRKPGFDTFETTVNLTDGSIQIIDAILAPPTGTLNVSGSPVGATVKVAGNKRCVIPCTERVEVGRYSLEVSNPGFESVSQDVEIKRGEVAPITVALEKAIPISMGSIVVNTKPWSSVTANGRSLGQTPAKGRIKAGTVKLVMTDGQGRKLVKTVNVPANRETTFFFPF